MNDPDRSAPNPSHRLLIPLPRGLRLPRGWSRTVLLVLLLTACGPDHELPEGTLLMGRTESVLRLLDRVELLTGTPAAEAATEVHRRIATCEAFLGRCVGATPCRLIDELACRDPRDTQYAELIQDGDWFFSRTLGQGRWGQLRGRRLGDGTWELVGQLSPARGWGALSLVLPGESPPGPSRLRQEQALVHARLSPDSGLNLASLVEPEGWGARLFQLQSDLFLATALAGTWELAIYQPEEGQRIPPLALALDFTNRQRAVAAMESFLEDLARSWPVRRSPFTLQGFEGACLSNLNVLPELAPCYVATDAALLAGWNPSSLEQALGQGGAVAGTQSVESQLTLYLDRFPEADAKLARASGGDPNLTPDYPWHELRITGARNDGSYLFNLTLVPRAPP